jgi:hypothetical protein
MGIQPEWKGEDCSGFQIRYVAAAHSGNTFRESFVIEIYPLRRLKRLSAGNS